MSSVAPSTVDASNVSNEKTSKDFSFCLVFQLSCKIFANNTEEVLFNKILTRMNFELT